MSYAILAYTFAILLLGGFLAYSLVQLHEDRD